MAISNVERNIIRYNGRAWNLYRKVLIPVDPPHIDIGVTTEECRELHGICKPWFIRWTSDWDCERDTGFWYIIKDGREDPADYSSKTRNSINRGIRNFHAKIVPKELIKKDGYGVYLKAFGRYRTTEKPLGPEDFQSQLDGLFSIGEWEFWGVFGNATGMLAGYAMNWISHGCCEYKTIKTDPESMKDSSSYLLIHAMNRHYLNDRGLRYVNDGSRSLRHESNIQGFLENRFHFRKAYCRMNIWYSPAAAAGVKVLFPLRKPVFSSRSGILQKLGVLLKHEEIVRNGRSTNK